MNAPETLLAELGDLLVFGPEGDDELVAGVLAAIEPSQRSRPRTRVPRLLVAAAVIVAVAAAVVTAIPSTRSAVADWFGLDRLTIDRHDEVDLPPLPSVTVPDPFAERTVVVDGRRILISTIDGDLTDSAIRKTVSGTSVVVPVEVGGNPGVWIPDAHEVMLERGDVPVFERIAGNTLLWQDGNVLWRVEGFGRIDDALRFAETSALFTRT
jgi:hypothetical protein